MVKEERRDSALQGTSGVYIVWHPNRRQLQCRLISREPSNIETHKVSLVMAAAAPPARGRNGSGERGEEDQALTRILVVEDDEFMAAALVSMLQTIAETNTASGAELCLQVRSAAPLHPCLCAASTAIRARAGRAHEHG